MAIVRTLNNREEEINIVKENPSINFISEAWTPWHAIGIDALILKLQNKGISIIAAIIIVEHEYGGFVLNEDNFSNDCYLFYRLPLQHSPSLEASRKSIIDRLCGIFQFYKFVFFDLQGSFKDTIYYNSPLFFFPQIASSLYAIGRHVVFCKSEEGVASYMGTIKEPYIRLSYVHSFADFRSYIRYTIFGRYFLFFTHKCYNERLFRNTWFGLKVNDSILPFYKMLFRKQSDKIVDIIDKEVIENSVIICTTAWKRDEIKDNEDLNVLKEVCNCLHSKGINILLKTHPRDSFFASKEKELHSKYLDTHGFSMECICENVKPRAIISFSSTVLVNAKIFWDIPVFCISNLLNRSKIGHVYLQEIDSFKTVFGRFISYVNEPNILI